MKKKFTILAAVAIAVIWAGLSLCAWLLPAKESSDSERRPLAQFPKVSAEKIFSGAFAEDFEEYTLDQFPLREGFRSIKAMFHRYVLGNRDNNGIYIVDDSAAELEERLDEESVKHALKQFNLVYDLYLQESDCKIYNAVVPDKGFYLAEANGYPAMDYAALFQMMEQGMPWAEQIDLTGQLTIEDYYRTDLHWRQENIEPLAAHIAEAMGVSTEKDFVPTALERPFYGVYYGQAALPMDPEMMYVMESDLIKACRVYNYTEDCYTEIYDPAKLESKDLYDIYLSGPQSLLRIENPNATTDRELVIFRDSFGSSLAPLLLQDYAAITLVDLRYIQTQRLGNYLEFTNQDVLFLHSTLVLNKKLI